jgi:serine protease Do
MVLTLAPVLSSAQEAQPGRAPVDGASTLVRVTLITETRGAPGLFVVNDKLIPDYRPKIYGFFPATGVVIDDDGHVLSYLGYRWIDLQGARPRAEVISLEGEKHPAKLIGIDQSLGVAVVRAGGARLKRTPICPQCEIRPDETVVVPVFEKMGMPAEFQLARIVNVGSGGDAASGGAWQISLSREFKGFGEPLLNRDHQVLGFIAENDLFFPISQFLTSAERVLRAGGDIRTGWLGVYVEVEDPGLRADAGVRIKSIENDSPASKAGLLPGDVLRTWNGREINDEREFIRTVQETPIGSKASIGILRQGKPMTLTALVEARKPQPVPEKFVFSFPETMNRQDLTAVGEGHAAQLAVLGVDTVPLTPKLAEVLNIPVRGGLLVANVDLQKIFDQAGVQVGDVITLVDGQPIVTSAGFLSHLQSRGPGARVILKLLRKGEERVISIRLPFSRPAKP